MSYKILIMGLPGSGKTSLACFLNLLLIPNSAWLNADIIRKQFDDWDFSYEGRIRQAERMKSLAENIPSKSKYVICDFVAPLPEMREIFDADYTVWVDTVKKSKYEDTDSLFVPPKEYDLRVTHKDVEYWAEIIYKNIIGKV